MGVNIQHVIRDCYDMVQKRAEDVMAEITLAEVLVRYEEKL